jgi:hypothetical protein
VSREKNPGAVALARLGGQAAAARLAKRAATMTAEERTDLARYAASCRWIKRRPIASLAHLLRILASMSTDPTGNAATKARELADVFDSWEAKP